MSETVVPVPAVDADAADLARYGYKQELKRSLHFFSSFAAAFSYISPATGIFTLFILGVGTLGGAFFWTWPGRGAGQFIVALILRRGVQRTSRSRARCSSGRSTSRASRPTPGSRAGSTCGPAR